MLMIAGASLRMAILIPSLLCFTSMIYLFVIFATEFSQSLYLGVASTFVFLNLSGFGFISWFFMSKRQDSSVDYVYNLGGGVTTLWSHPIMQYMLASRGSVFLLSLSISIFLILLTTVDAMSLVAVGGLLGLMIPIEHQGFLSVFIVVFTHLSCKFYFTKEKKKRQKLLTGIKRGVVAFVVIGFIPFVNLKSNSMDVSLMKMEFFWSDLTRNGYFFGSIFTWWQNTGVFFLIVLLFGWVVLSKEQNLIYLPTIFTFVIGNLFLFQPYSNYNIHFFYPTWVVISSVVFCMFLKHCPNFVNNEEIKGIVIALAIITYASTIASSIMGLIKMWNSETTVWTEADEKVASFVAANTHTKDIFMSLETPWEPISVLAGRRLFVHSAYRMWLYGYQWFRYRDEREKLCEDPESDVALPAQYALEHLHRDVEHHLSNPGRTLAWRLAFAYESYELYNRTTSRLVTPS